MLASNIVLGAVCGAVAALLAFLGLRTTKLSDRTKAAVSFAIFWALFSVVKIGGIPVLDRYRAWAALDEMPLFIAMKAYEPVAYQQLRQRFAEGDQSDAAAMRAAMFSVVMETAAKRLPRASNEAAYDALAANTDTIEFLYKRGDETCYQYIHKDRYPQIAFEALLPASMLLRDQTTMAEVLRSAAKEGLPIPSEETVMPSFQRAGKALSTDEINGLENLDGKTNLVEQRRSCAITSKFFRAIMGLPKQQAGEAFRYLLAQAT